MAEPEAEDVSEAAVRGYFLHKAFDVISDGEYKRLVAARRDVGDEWAVELGAQVQGVAGLIKGVVRQVHGLHEYGRDKLQAHCLEVLGHVNPPCRLRHCWNTCTLSGIRSGSCLDLTRPGKSPGVMTVHRSFRHFMLLLWVVTKFENLCKGLARAWLKRLDAEEVRGASVNALCKRFQTEHDVAPALHALFRHALRHVSASLAAQGPRLGRGGRGQGEGARAPE
jgi:hypothetical protein